MLCAAAPLRARLAPDPIGRKILSNATAAVIPIGYPFSIYSALKGNAIAPKGNPPRTKSQFTANPLRSMMSSN
jgi:hypothetical protein